MNTEYSDYLKSDAWHARREERLSASKHRCAACGSSDRLQVHHLTYQRIFNEDMSDLLPLCRKHHEAAEKLVSSGFLPRSENVLFLATETIRLILQHNQRNQPQRKKKTIGEPKNKSQQWLMEQQWFKDALFIKRNDFKRLLHKKIQRSPARGRLLANAFAIFDHHKWK